MEKLWQLSANDLASGIREKKFSAREVVASVLERIAAKNPELNAITVEFPEEALSAADAADEAIAWASGRAVEEWIFSASYEWAEGGSGFFS